MKIAGERSPRALGARAIAFDATGSGRVHRNGNESAGLRRSARRAPLPGLRARSRSRARRCAAPAARSAPAQTAGAGSADDRSSPCCPARARRAKNRCCQTISYQTCLLILSRPLDQLGEVLFFGIEWRSRMDHLRGAFFRRAHQVAIGAALGILNIRVPMFVVGEDFGIDGGAFVAGRALRGIDPRSDITVAVRRRRRR